MHVRAQIRTRIADRLSGRHPIVGVARSRTESFDVGELPAVRVMILDEESTNSSQGSNPTQQRTAMLEIELLAKELPGQHFDDVLDEMAMVVEQAISEDQTIDGLVDKTVYTGMRSDFSDDQPEGRVFLGYQITYFTRMQSPEAAA